MNEYHEVHAFTGEHCAGNPAAVVMLEDWPEAEHLQHTARDIALPATAFVTPCTDHFQVRWFTPARELQLCGHATLAAATLLFRQSSAAGNQPDALHFATASGLLTVVRRGALLAVTLPAIAAGPVIACPAPIEQSLGTLPLSVHLADNGNHLALLPDAAAVRAVQPDFSRLTALEGGLMITAVGEDCDFVSRFFVPAAGTDEDHATGSAHCTLAPWWAQRLEKTVLEARQLSPRGGTMRCEVALPYVTLLAQTRWQGTYTLNRTTPKHSGR